MKHRGRAVVFETMEDYHQRIDDPCIGHRWALCDRIERCWSCWFIPVCLKSAMSISWKIIAKGYSRYDPYFRWTNSGDCCRELAVLHVSPESSIGGVLALVKDGDMQIELDVASRKAPSRCRMMQLQKKKPHGKHLRPMADRGYVKSLYRSCAGASRCWPRYFAGLLGIGGNKGLALSRESGGWSL